MRLDKNPMAIRDRVSKCKCEKKKKIPMAICECRCEKKKKIPMAICECRYEKKKKIQWLYASAGTKKRKKIQWVYTTGCPSAGAKKNEVPITVRTTLSHLSYKSSCAQCFCQKRVTI